MQTQLVKQNQYFSHTKPKKYSLAHANVISILQISKLKKKTENVYSLEYTEIPKLFFASQHDRQRQQVASLIITVQWPRGLTSLLLERNTINIIVAM
jgi:hypothetical protein